MEVFKLNHPQYKLSTNKTIDQVFNHQHIENFLKKWLNLL